MIAALEVSRHVAHVLTTARPVLDHVDAAALGEGGWTVASRLLGRRRLFPAHPLPLSLPFPLSTYSSTGP